MRCDAEAYAAIEVLANELKPRQAALSLLPRRNNLRLEDVLDVMREFVGRKRLGDDCHARLKVVVADGCVEGITGHEQDSQVRQQYTSGIGKLPSVEPAGQAHTRQ